MTKLFFFGHWCHYHSVPLFAKCRQRSNVAKRDCWLMHQAASPQRYLTTEFKLKIEGVCSGLCADKAIFHSPRWDFAQERFYFSLSALCVCAYMFVWRTNQSLFCLGFFFFRDICAKQREWSQALTNKRRQEAILIKKTTLSSLLRFYFFFFSPTNSFVSKIDWLYMTRNAFLFWSAAQEGRCTHWWSFSDQPAALRPNVNNEALMRSFWV